MRRLSRRQVVLTAVAASLTPSIAFTQPPAHAEGPIPDGVFVREADGTLWLVLGGQRVAVVTWQAADADIAALPISGRYAVMNAQNAIVAGERPAWYAEPAQAPTAAAAQPSSAAPTPAAPAPVAEPAAATVPPPPNAPVSAPAPAAALPRTDPNGLPADAPATSPAASTGAGPRMTEPTVVVVDQTYYEVAASRTTFIAGLLENRSAAPLAVRVVELTLLGLEGENVVTTNSQYEPALLAPGARAGFLSSFANAPKFVDVRIRVESAPPDPIVSSSVTHELRVEGVTQQARSGSSLPRIIGMVVNRGSQTIEQPQVLVAVFTPDGKLLDVSHAYGTVAVLAPGQPSPFEVEMRAHWVQEITKYEIYTEGRVRR